MTLGITLSLAGCGGGGGGGSGVNVSPPTSGGGNTINSSVSVTPVPVASRPKDRSSLLRPGTRSTVTIARLNASSVQFLGRDIGGFPATLMNVGGRPHQGIGRANTSTTATINFGSPISTTVETVVGNQTLIADGAGFLGVYNATGPRDSNRFTSTITPQSAVLGGGVTNSVTHVAVTTGIGVRRYAGTVNSFFLTAEYAGYINIVDGFTYYYGGGTPYATIRRSGVDMKASYTIPAHAAVGYAVFHLQNAVWILSNSNAGELSADFRGGYVTLNLTMDGHYGNPSEPRVSYLTISGFQMRIWTGGFDNFSCRSSGGSSSANCAGTFSYLGDTTITNSVSTANDTIYAAGGFHGPSAEEAVVNIGHWTENGSGAVTQFVNIGLIGRGWGAYPYVLATSAASKIGLSNAKYYSSNWDVGRNIAFTLATDSNGRPSSWDGGFNTPFPWHVSNFGTPYSSQSRNVTLFFRTTGGTDAPITLNIGASGLKIPTAGVDRDFPVSDAVVAINSSTAVTHSFNISFYTGGDYDVFHFIGAEYAAFAHGFDVSGGIGDEGFIGDEYYDAYYGAITPRAVMSVLAATNLRATYTIPQGGAQGFFYSASNSSHGRLLYNGDAGALAADFGAGLVALNLTVDGYAPSGALTDDFLKIDGFQMTVDGNIFHNYHCPSSTYGRTGTNCGGGFDYTSANSSANALDLNNAVAGSNANRIRAGGMFAGPSAEEVAGGIGQFTNDGRTGMRLYFLAAGKGGRQ